MSEQSGKVDTTTRREPLDELLLIITSEPLRAELLKLIDLPRLLQQLQPAIQVLHFGGKVVPRTQFVDATTPEPLTEAERALLSEYPWPRTEVDRAMTKLLALHDHLQARAKELEREKEYRDQCALERSERD